MYTDLFIIFLKREWVLFFSIHFSVVPKHVQNIELMIKNMTYFINLIGSCCIHYFKRTNYKVIIVFAKVLVTGIYLKKQGEAPKQKEQNHEEIFSAFV